MSTSSLCITYPRPRSSADVHRQRGAHIGLEMRLQTPMTEASFLENQRQTA